MHVAATQRAAAEEARENLTYFVRRHVELMRAGLGRADTGPAERRAARASQIAELSYEEILATRAVVGTAARVAERLVRLRDDLGLSGIIAELNPGGLLPFPLMQRTLAALGGEIAPALR